MLVTLPSVCLWRSTPHSEGSAGGRVHNDWPTDRTSGLTQLQGHIGRMWLVLLQVPISILTFTLMEIRPCNCNWVVKQVVFCYLTKHVNVIVLSGYCPKYYSPRPPAQALNSLTHWLGGLQCRDRPVYFQVHIAPSLSSSLQQKDQ